MSDQESTPYETIVYAKQHRRATITLNRPERRNATNTRMYEEILAAARAADRDPGRACRDPHRRGNGVLCRSGQQRDRRKGHCRLRRL